MDLVQISDGWASRLPRLAVVTLAAAAVAFPCSVASAEPARVFEKVSPPDTGGHAVWPVAISPSGDSVRLESGGGFAGTPGQEGLTNHYLARRTPVGWLTTPLGLSSAEFQAGPGRLVATDPGLDRSLVLGATYAERDNGATRFYYRLDAGQLVPASPPIQRQVDLDARAEFVNYEGGTSDLSQFIFSTSPSMPVLPGESTGGSSNSNIYEVVDAGSGSSYVRRVDLWSDGSVVGPACGSKAGGPLSLKNLISEDGSKIFFSGRRPSTPTGCAASTRGPLRIFARIGGTVTVEVSASECSRVADPAASPPVSVCAAPATSPAAAQSAADAQFRGASADGSRVFFTTSQQLTNDDMDSAVDLYVYDFGPAVSGRRLTRLSRIDQALPQGTGATASGVAAIAEDGSRVYFVAQGVLTGSPGASGDLAVAGQPNLYVAERNGAGWTTTFIAQLATTDTRLWSGDAHTAHLASADGAVLVFESAAQQTADDLDGSIDVFRYKAETHRILRVSVADSSGEDTGNGAFDATLMYGVDSSSRRVASSDGRLVVFSTGERLAAGDSAGTIDLFEWNDGAVKLVTGGGDALFGTGRQGYDVTPDGGSIAFSTSQPLTPDDRNTSVDTYVARRGGGLPYDRREGDPCLGDVCQGPGAGLLASPLTPTVLFRGPGNAIGQSGRSRTSRTSVRFVAGRRAGPASMTVKLRVSSAGGVRVRGGGVKAAARTVRKAGDVSVRIELTRAAIRQLRRTGRHVVRLTVLFRPAGSRSRVVARKSLTFRGHTNVSRSR